MKCELNGLLGFLVGSVLTARYYKKNISWLNSRIEGAEAAELMAEEERDGWKIPKSE